MLYKLNVTSKYSSKRAAYRFYPHSQKKKPSVKTLHLSAQFSSHCVY